MLCLKFEADLSCKQRVTKLFQKRNPCHQGIQKYTNTSVYSIDRTPVQKNCQMKFLKLSWLQSGSHWIKHWGFKGTPPCLFSTKPVLAYQYLSLAWPNFLTGVIIKIISDINPRTIRTTCCFLRTPHFSLYTIHFFAWGAAGMAQWWECLPPSNVASVWFWPSAMCGLSLLFIVALH